MKEIIFEYLNDELFYLESSNCVLSISNNCEKIGYSQIEQLIKKIFNLSDDLAHAITFNWLLFNGVKLVKKNWNKMYATHNTGYTIQYESTSTDDVDFEYKMIPNM